MCAQPCGSTASMMKSSRCRFELGARHAIPRLQMSPMCIGVVVICVPAQVAFAGLEVRVSDCAAYRFQLHVGGYVVGLPLAGPGPAQPPGLALPNGSVGMISVVRRYATSTCPGSPAAIAGNQWVPVSLGELTRYALAALPGIRPPPPSQCEPPSLDHTTYMSDSQEASDCTVPTVDSAEHVAGFELRLAAKPK